MAPDTPSATLASFVSDLAYDQLPDVAVRLAERCFLDTVGVTVAGANEGAGAAAARTLARWSDGDAPLLGRGETTSLLGAVFANATAGHALDFDDFTWATDGHPSVPVVAPVLALAVATGASGRDALTAFAAGFETQCFLAAPVSPSHYERGWHATATFGAFGAAAAAANLLSLTPAETRHALNVAASTPAGLKRNFGSMTKPMHVGQAARSGVTAALLAAAGFTAAPEAIGGAGGFWDLYAGGDAPDTDALPALGERWGLVEDGVQVKQYPCCYFTHAAITAVTDLVGDHGLAAGDVESIRVRASPGAADALAHDDPSTPLEAKFSMPYTVAYALVHGTVDLAAFEPGAIADPVVQGVRERVALAVDRERHYDSTATEVAVETVGGGRVEAAVETPPGTHDDPLPVETLREKFRMCATRVVPEADAEAALRGLDALREQEAVADVLDPLCVDER